MEPFLRIGDAILAHALRHPGICVKNPDRSQRPHHIAPARRDYEGILERYATELRKYGMGVVVMSTRPTQVSENIIANSDTVICHSMTSGKDVDLAMNYMVSRLE